MWLQLLILDPQRVPDAASVLSSHASELPPAQEQFAVVPLVSSLLAAVSSSQLFYPWFSSQGTLNALLPWGCCRCFSGVHYHHILLFFSSGMLSLNSCFPCKLLIHSNFQGLFAFWGNRIGSIDSFITVISTLQNIIFVPRMFQELSSLPCIQE